MTFVEAVVNYCKENPLLTAILIALAVFIAIIIAIIIVLAMNLVGSLLISALIIFPALSAMRIYKSFKSVTICSAVISVLCSLSGLIISILAGTPVGSTIVACDIGAFILCSLGGKICKGV
jgi:zinc transport system permease protein